MQARAEDEEPEGSGGRLEPRVSERRPGTGNEHREALEPGAADVDQPRSAPQVSIPKRAFSGHRWITAVAKTSLPPTNARVPTVRSRYR